MMFFNYAAFIYLPQNWKIQDVLIFMPKFGEFRYTLHVCVRGEIYCVKKQTTMSS